MDQGLLKKMQEGALAALTRSYAPYSQFAVGASLLTTSGFIYCGCNIENASYGLTLCAEAVAIGHMIAAGEQQIKAAVIVSSDGLCPPCGACRQRLSEFAADDMAVYLFAANGQQQRLSMLELLPFPFKPEHFR